MTADGPIAVASFPDPRQEPEEENLQFSLESGMLHFTETHYLTFKKYLATAGVQLMVCLDPNAKKCFWKSAPLTFRATQAQRNRAWSTELIQIPQGSYKLFLLARYDNSQRFNAGQIGLGYVRLFRDAQLKIPLC
uniref:Uncharacterized protein n=1 Tax=Plectus sambesii TaxID=2011161 RepID=A0A914XR10_9BILA